MPKQIQTLSHQTRERNKKKSHKNTWLEDKKEQRKDNQNGKKESSSQQREKAVHLFCGKGIRTSERTLSHVGDFASLPLQEILVESVLVVK